MTVAGGGPVGGTTATSGAFKGEMYRQKEAAARVC